MKTRKVVIAVVSFCLFGTHVVANFEHTQQKRLTCSQPEAERNALISEAEKDKYTARKLEFVGNENIRDVVLRRRILVNEGDFFTRKILEESLANLSKVKIIEKVGLGNVVIKLDRKEKVVDMVICVTDKRERKNKPAEQK
jgi:outer membrane protein assembly factor BamA